MSGFKTANYDVTVFSKNKNTKLDFYYGKANGNVLINFVNLEPKSVISSIDPITQTH